MVKTERPPDRERTLRFPARIDTTVEGASKYGHCCCETAIVLTGLLQSAVLTDALREKWTRLRDQQRALAEAFADALTAASTEMKAREEAMSELPLVGGAITPSHNRPPATGRFVICETPACGKPMTVAQSEGSLKECGNRLCAQCGLYWRRSKEQREVSELPLEGIETSEGPQAFR